MNILNDKRFAGKFAFTAGFHFSKIMSCLEGWIFGNEPPRLPPIFIIGLPRGGTTLVYQTLCHCFELAYTPMLTNYLFLMPSLSIWMCKNWQYRYSSDFKSHYGKSEGMAYPGEGTMWNLWFSKNKYYQGIKDIEKSKAIEIIRFAGRTERILNAPFVNKNLRNNNRIGVLAELFPAAVFLIVLRHPRDAALSLLRGRIEVYGDVNRLYSIQPRTYNPSVYVSPEKSVIGQLNGIIKDIHEQMLRIGNRRFEVICYEDFCTDPSIAVRRVSDFMSENGLTLRQRQSPPISFNLRQGRTNKLLPEQIEAIDKSLSEDFDWDIYNHLIQTHQ